MRSSAGGAVHCDRARSIVPWRCHSLTPVPLQTDRGLIYGIEASDDLRAWTRLVTFTNLTEAVRFVDEQSTLEPRRLNRAVSP